MGVDNGGSGFSDKQKSACGMLALFFHLSVTTLLLSQPESFCSGNCYQHWHLGVGVEAALDQTMIADSVKGSLEEDPLRLL